MCGVVNGENELRHEVFNSKQDTIKIRHEINGGVRDSEYPLRSVIYVKDVYSSSMGVCCSVTVTCPNLFSFPGLEVVPDYLGDTCRDSAFISPGVN